VGLFSLTVLPEATTGISFLLGTTKMAVGFVNLSLSLRLQLELLFCQKLLTRFITVGFVSLTLLPEARTRLSVLFLNTTKLACHRGFRQFNSSP
jgi:hypothetical protein